MMGVGLPEIAVVTSDRVIAVVTSDRVDKAVDSLGVELPEDCDVALGEDSRDGLSNLDCFVGDGSGTAMGLGLTLFVGIKL